MSFVSASQLHSQGHNQSHSGHHSSSFYGSQSFSPSMMDLDEARFQSHNVRPSPGQSPSPRHPSIEYNQKPLISQMHSPSPGPMPGVDYRAYSAYLEHQNRALLERVKALEAQCEVQQQHILMTTGLAPKGVPAYFQPAFKADWAARTDARKALFCSNNRNGISSCSWHASRHQPKGYAPRSAPEGVLNCECTAEEALFEASLASHGVGAYKSGSNSGGNGREPRMDPHLRRSLLRLLKRRYGYRDGDFEIDPHTGMWIYGENSTAWIKRKEAGQKDCPPVHAQLSDPKDTPPIHAHLSASSLIQMQSPLLTMQSPPLPLISPLSPQASTSQLQSLSSSQFSSHSPNFTQSQL